MGSRPTTHVWEETPAVKPGDTIKLIDKLTPEERAAVNRIRELGETKVLDIKAQFLEEAASAARAHANASKLLDNNSWLEATHYEQRESWPGWGIAAAVVMLAIAVLMVAIRNDRHSTLPEKSAQNTTLEAPAESKSVAATEEGGAPPAPRAASKGSRW